MSPESPLTDPRLAPPMRAVLERIARRAHPPLHSLDVSEARRAYEAAANVLEVPVAPLPVVLPLQIPVRDGSTIGARLYRPLPLLAGVAPMPALLYCHGGGFTIGSVDTHDVLCRELARLTPCTVLSLDYRRAPEHRFPTAVHDVWDTLRWLHGQGWASVGADPHRLAVGGDSAGGTLAAVAAAWARDEGLHLCLQLLFYPGCAAHADTHSHRRHAHGPVLDARQIAWFFDHYIASHARTDWRFAPLHLDDAEGLAPAWFGLAEIDPLVDEGLMYADKLRAAGVQVDLELYRGVTHEFIKMGRVLPQALQAHRDAAAALARAFDTCRVNP